MDEAAATNFEIQWVSPRGRGAVGVLQLRGAATLDLLPRFFKPAQGSTASSGYGCFIDDAGRTIDDGLLLSVPGDPPTFWLTLHGNPVLLSRLVEHLTRIGGTEVTSSPSSVWPAARARGSRVAQESWELLVNAPTSGAAGFLLHQASAGLSQWAQEATGRTVLAEEVRDLLRWANVGRSLFEPKRVVLAGAPNAGKSTLFNALLGQDRVVAHETAGTTRDLIRETALLGDFPIVLTDGAGLRETEDRIEQQGVSRMVTALGGADLVVWLTPVGESPAPNPQHWVPGESPLLPIHSQADRSSRSQDFADSEDLYVSAVTGAGLQRLQGSMAQALWGREVELADEDVLRAPRGRSVPFLERHQQLLETGLEALERGEDASPVWGALHGAD